jgi:vitamin B12 transporter
VDARAGAGFTFGQSYLSLAASHMSGQGFTPVVDEQKGLADRPASYDQASLSARLISSVGPRTELQVSGLLFKDARERGSAFSNIRTTGADVSLRIVGSKWIALAYVQDRSFYNSFAALNPVRSLATRTAEQYEVPSTGYGSRIEFRPLLGADAELRLGGEWREVEGETRERYSFVGGEPTRSRRAGGRSRTLGAFAEATGRSGPLLLTGGARIDRWMIAEGFLEERLLATDARLTDERFAARSGWRPTGRAGAAIKFTETFTVRGAAYLGWRLPALNELYRPFRVGADATAANADLAPERLRGAEVGVEYRPLSGARVGLTLFANRLADGIANVTLGEGPGTFAGVGFVAAGGQYRRRSNIEAIETRGIEVDGRYDWGRWSLSGGYSYADARVRALGAALRLNGLRPAQTPRHGLAATLAWQSPEGRRANVSARYTTSQFEDDLNLQRLAGALIFDAVVALPLARGISAEFRAENLTDQRIVAGISGTGIVERGTPRTLWLGLRFID